MLLSKVTDSHGAIKYIIALFSFHQFSSQAHTYSSVKLASLAFVLQLEILTDINRHLAIFS